MNDFSMDGATRLLGKFGVAAQFSEGIRSNVGANVNVHQLSSLADPRYTLDLHRGMSDRGSSRIFVESLFGVGHAYNVQNDLRVAFGISYRFGTAR